LYILDATNNMCTSTNFVYKQNILQMINNNKSSIFTEYIFLEFQSLSLLHRLNIHSKARENCRWQMLKNKRRRIFISKKKSRRKIHLHNNLVLRENKHNNNRIETWLNLTTKRMNRSERWIINERSISVRKEPYNKVNEDKSKRKKNDLSQNKIIILHDNRW